MLLYHYNVSSALRQTMTVTLADEERDNSISVR